MTDQSLADRLAVNAHGGEAICLVTPIKDRSKRGALAAKECHIFEGISLNSDGFVNAEVIKNTDGVGRDRGIPTQKTVLGPRFIDDA